MKNNRFFITITLSLALSINVFSQNNREKSPEKFISSIEIKKAMQQRKMLIIEQKLKREKQLHEQKLKREEAEKKLAEMQVKTHALFPKSHKSEANSMRNTKTIKNLPNTPQQKEVSKLALDSTITPEDYKTTFRYNYEGKVIETIEYYWDTDKWEPGYKAEYIYSGDIEKIINYYWVAGNWELDWKSEYTYDDKGYRTMEAYYYWDTDHWVGNGKSEYTYDDKGYRTMEAYYHWDTDHWVGNWKEEYDYDNEGYKIMEAEYYWDTDHWKGNWKDEYAYDDKGYQSMYAYYEWENGNWKGIDKNEYNSNVGNYFTKEFNSNIENYITDITYTWNSVKNEWEYSYKHEYSEDFSGNLLLGAEYYWNNNSNKWEGDWKHECAYDDKGNITLFKESAWNDSTNTWKEIFKATLSYLHNLEFETSEYYWNDSINNWIETSKIEGVSNPNGSIAMQIAYEWNGNDWDTISKRKTTVYDTAGNMMQAIVIQSNYPLWTPKTRIDFLWDSEDNCTETTIYTLKGVNQTESEKYEYAYDNEGYKTMEAYYYWDTDHWVGNWKEEYDYDNEGYKIMEAEYYWDTDKWKGNWKYEYRLRGKDGITYTYAYYYWATDHWKGNYKVEEVYDDKGWQTLYAYRYDWLNDTWEYGDKTIYDYDINGNTILKEYYNWDNTNDTWVANNKGEYAYTTHDRLLFDKYYKWDGTAWILSNSEEYTYNTKGDFIKYTRSNIVNDTFSLREKAVYTYDTTYSLANLVFSERYFGVDIFSQFLRSDYFEYNNDSVIIAHDSAFLYWSSINVWSSPTYTIKGKVDVDGEPLKGVQINYGNNLWVSTNSDGEYTLQVDSGSTVVLVPTKEGYLFTPTFITCNNVSGNLINKNFFTSSLNIDNVQNTNTELLVYPNPTKGIVYINITSKIKLFDVQGKKLQEIYDNHIDISTYPQGMYFLQVDKKTIKIIKE